MKFENVHFAYDPKRAILKGGVVLELRLERARATRDVGFGDVLTEPPETVDGTIS